jgi:hypothetical protein
MERSFEGGPGETIIREGIVPGAAVPAEILSDNAVPTDAKLAVVR